MYHLGELVFWNKNEILSAHLLAPSLYIF